MNIDKDLIRQLREMAALENDGGLRGLREIVFTSAANRLEELTTAPQGDSKPVAALPITSFHILFGSDEE